MASTVLPLMGDNKEREVETICSLGTGNTSYTNCNQKTANTEHMTMTIDGTERTVTFGAEGYFMWHTTGTAGTSTYTNSSYEAGKNYKVAAGDKVTFTINGSSSNFYVLGVAFTPI